MFYCDLFIDTQYVLDILLLLYLQVETDQIKNRISFVHLEGCTIFLKIAMKQILMWNIRCYAGN